MKKLSDLPRACFEGVLPSMLATVSPDGVPNITWLSQVDYLDDRHVALSCQFFRKTRANLSTDPRAQLLVIDPQSFKQWRLDLRFSRRDTAGPAFEAMAHRIHAIAQLTRTEHAFQLQSADVFEVMMISEVDVQVEPSAQPAQRERDLVQALAGISEIIARSRGLEGLLQSGLEQLTRQLGYETLSVYLAEQSEQSLYALASVGYLRSGVGARIPYGVGLIGMAAQNRAPVRIADVRRELHYGRIVREQLERASGALEREVPLPSLVDTLSFVAVPLLIDGELFGVLSSESAQRLNYDDRDVMVLQTVGQMLGQAIARALERAKEAGELDVAPPTQALTTQPGVLKVHYYEADDSVFIDGEYLIKGLPGRILWLLLTIRQREGRDTFLNRELRLHPLLKLPSYKDNLEARLLMLQRRLEDKGTSLRIAREQRGRLRLSCAVNVELEHTPV
ncbi:MAG TPA: GAF domain-containing protein [Polyangiales bacterium]|nr:GAF domain-containing protein [Polyangiales bacterium]